MNVMASHGKIAALQQLEPLAATQHGYLTRAQALQAGVGDLALHRLSRSGLLIPADHGTYRLLGAPDLPSVTWTAIWVAWLRLDPATPAVLRAEAPTSGTGAIARGPTAAFVQDLGNLGPDPYQFWVARPRQSRRDLVLRTARGGLPASDITIVHGLPATSATRTIGDLVTDHHDLTHVAAVVRDALDRRLLDPRDPARELSEVLARVVPKRRHIEPGALTRQLLSLAGGS